MRLSIFLWPACRPPPCSGVEASPVQVEVDVSFGMPIFTMVGLPDASVRESRDRVRSAIRNSGFEFPPHRVTVNLAPADVRKAGAAVRICRLRSGILAAPKVAIARRDVADVRDPSASMSLDGGHPGRRAACCRSSAAARRAARIAGVPAAACPNAPAKRPVVSKVCGCYAVPIARGGRRRAERPSDRCGWPTGRPRAAAGSVRPSAIWLGRAGPASGAARAGNRRPRAATTCCSSGPPGDPARR